MISWIDKLTLQIHTFWICLLTVFSCSFWQAFDLFINIIQFIITMDTHSIQINIICPVKLGVKNWYQRQLCIWLWLDNNIEKKQKQLGVEHLHRLSQAKSKKKENDDHIIMYTTCMSSSQVNFIYLNMTTCDVINRNSWSLTIGKRITRVGILSTAF